MASHSEQAWLAGNNSQHLHHQHQQVMLQAIPIALLTYLESVSVGRKYALVHKYALDMTQELWALGFGCLFASFFQAYPPGGSFSRTALQYEVS